MGCQHRLVWVDPQRLVFVGEMRTNTFLAALRAWACRGQRAYCSVPRIRGPNTILFSSMSVEGMGPSLTVEGATTAAVSEAYVEEVVAPSLRPSQLVLMDNLWAHKVARVRELVEERGCKLLYLLPYSPDLSPIEEACSKIKSILRKVTATADCRDVGLITSSYGLPYFFTVGDFLARLLLGAPRTPSHAFITPLGSMSSQYAVGAGRL